MVDPILFVNTILVVVSLLVPITFLIFSVSSVAVFISTTSDFGASVTAGVAVASTFCSGATEVLFPQPAANILAARIPARIK